MTGSGAFALQPAILPSHQPTTSAQPASFKNSSTPAACQASIMGAVGQLEVYLNSKNQKDRDGHALASSSWTNI